MRKQTCRLFASKLNLLLQQGIPKSRFHRRFAWV